MIFLILSFAFSSLSIKVFPSSKIQFIPSDFISENISDKERISWTNNLVEAKKDGAETKNLKTSEKPCWIELLLTPSLLPSLNPCDRLSFGHKIPWLKSENFSLTNRIKLLTWKNKIAARTKNKTVNIKNIFLKFFFESAFILSENFFLLLLSSFILDQKPPPPTFFFSLLGWRLSIK